MLFGGIFTFNWAYSKQGWLSGVECGAEKYVEDRKINFTRNKIFAIQECWYKNHAIYQKNE